MSASRDAGPVSDARAGAEIPGGLRQRMRAAIEAAKRQGFAGADALWHRTPAQAAAALEAFCAGEWRRARRDERLAWMIGYYCALAVHAPGSYPRRPDALFGAPCADAPMTEAQMKAALLALAGDAGKAVPVPKDGAVLNRAESACPPMNDDGGEALW